MNISAFGSNTIVNGYNSTTVNDNTKTISFSDKMSKVNEKSEVELNLEYYHSLCKEFPGITFRLGDMETALKQNAMGKISLGYNGSMHQVGENFAGIGQCSIEIDVSVISRMRTDKNYETAAKWYIKDSRERFSEYMTEVPEEPYVAVCLEDVNGKIQLSRMHSPVRIPTEEESREKLGLDSFDVLKLDPDKMTDNLIDLYLKMIEDSEQKRKDLIEKMQDKENNQKADEADTRFMKHASDEYIRSFAYA